MLASQMADWDEAAEAVERLVRLALAWRRGRAKQGAPSAHDDDHNVLLKVLKPLRDHQVVARRGKSRITQKDLVRWRLRERVAEALDLTDADHAASTIVEHFDALGLEVTNHQVQRALDQAAFEDSGEPDEEARPSAHQILATARQHKLGAVALANWLIDHLTTKMPDRPVRSGRMAETVAGLVEEYDLDPALAPYSIEAMGRGAAPGSAFPLTFLLNEILGYPLDRVQTALRILYGGQAVLDLSGVEEKSRQEWMKRREAARSESDDPDSG